ncbi:hypothetical protein [Lichenifustis flavocetrariae]|uniref:Uncharacterized protein n=1 Tax=Lichenifustis flavocetrariae TaxID=2949735 RepID=A0AA41Z9N7_9HYPH|nr:hypothetical protein [Lichenifustis flavocetrariae]MCW6513058.1 hypothetical protein [Lichenifustis flavocetrariae]
MAHPLDVTDKDALIAALMTRIEELLALNTALMARVEELEAKLGLPPKTPDNSSLPPSKGPEAVRIDAAQPQGQAASWGAPPPASEPNPHT